MSYILAGSEDLDFSEAVSKVKQIFGKDDLLLNGGGGINWSLLKEGLVN